MSSLDTHAIRLMWRQLWLVEEQKDSRLSVTSQLLQEMEIRSPYPRLILINIAKRKSSLIVRRGTLTLEVIL